MNFSTWQGHRSRDPRRLALGSAQWGMPYGVANGDGPPNHTELSALLDLADAAGIRTVDTARAYGQAEARIGTSPLARDGWRIVTKLSAEIQGEGDGLIEVLEAVSRSLDESREALGLDRLPTLLLHRFAHRHLCGGRVWRMLLAERDAGRIGALGVSAATPEEAWAALEDPDIEVLQVATSLLDRRLYRHGFFARARELGRTIFVRSIYLQGIVHLAPENLPSALRSLAAPLTQIREAAAELGVTPAALCLAFARDLTGATVLLGCERADQLAQNLKDWESQEIGSAEIARLVETLPDIPEELLDPSRWPLVPAKTSPAEASETTANQTTATSVATVPT